MGKGFAGRTGQRLFVMAPVQRDGWAFDLTISLTSLVSFGFLASCLQFLFLFI